MASGPYLIVLDSVKQVLRCYSLVVFRNGYRASNSESMLDKKWSNSDYALNGCSTPFLFVVLLGILRICWKICIKI